MNIAKKYNTFNKASNKSSYKQGERRDVRRGKNGNKGQ